MILLFCLLLTGCFGSGIEKRGTVYGYENGRVKTVGGHFFVGQLPAYWKFEKIRARAVLFRNQQDQSTIAVSSWCKGAVDDEPQAELSAKVLQVIEDGRVIVLKKDLPLPEGTASQTVVEGLMDGQSVLVKTAVIKRHECVFDFYYVTRPGRTGFETDFDNMVRGFRYGHGPEIL